LMGFSCSSCMFLCYTHRNRFVKAVSSGDNDMAFQQA
jgi:hypothetical protein